MKNLAPCLVLPASITPQWDRDTAIGPAGSKGVKIIFATDDRKKAIGRFRERKSK